MKRFIGGLTACGLVVTLAGAAAASTPQTRVQHLGAETRTLEGRLMRGDLESVGGAFLDCYSFDVRAGQTVSVGMFSGDFDAFLVLYEDGACENAIANDDDSLGGTDPTITHAVSRSGRYSIAATSSFFDEGVGLYGLALIIE